MSSTKFYQPWFLYHFSQETPGHTADNVFALIMLMAPFSAGLKFVPDKYFACRQGDQIGRFCRPSDNILLYEITEVAKIWGLLLSQV
jgi:hypothetical protein